MIARIAHNPREHTLGVGLVAGVLLDVADCLADE